MLATTITTLLIYFMLQSAEAFALSTACWDERHSRAGRNSSCTASPPFLIFGHGKAIHRMGLDGKHHRRLVTAVGSSLLLDFHFKEETVYWADQHTGAIYKASVRGAHRQKLYSFDKHISGLAVDWILNSVYWTSGQKGAVKMMHIDGKNVKTLVRHLSKPSSIKVDPINRLLFWLSGGTDPSIQRSDVTGRKKVTLIQIKKQLKALSIDREDKKLFWAQFGLQGENQIASCDYNGNALRVIDQQLRPELLGLTLFMEYIYYTDATEHVIKQVSKSTVGNQQDVNTKKFAKPPVDIKVVHSLSQPMADSPYSSPDCDEKSGNCVSICSSPAEPGVCKCRDGFTLSQQGTHCEDVNECSHWNHGCSLGCENIPGSYFCTCPKGYALLPDRKTCQDIVPCQNNMTCGNGCLVTGNGAICVCPEGSVLQANGQTCTGCSSVDRGGCSQICSPVTPGRWQCACQPGYQLHQDGKQCIATGPPSYLLVANFVDVQKMSPDGSEAKTLVKEPRGQILAVDYDPVQNYVYFASTSQRTIERVHLNKGLREVLVTEGLSSPEGLAIDWVHRKMYWTDKSQSVVGRSALTGEDKEMIISKGLEKPRGIAVHPLAQKLFWTDTGSQPVVESASLQGRDRVVIANTNLVSPTGLTIDFADDQLFWCDQRKGLIESAALDGSDRRVISENQVVQHVSAHSWVRHSPQVILSSAVAVPGQPFDLTVFEDSLWISDWKHQGLRRVHKRTGERLQGIHTAMVQPASLVMVHPLAKPGTDACLHLNGGCVQLCESKLGFAHCSCKAHFLLSADGKTCFPVNASKDTAESGDVELTGRSTLNNTTSSYESTPLTSDFRSVHTDKMISDQHECDPLRCDVNAHCVLATGTPRCLCRDGFSGDGQFCVDLETSLPRATSSTPQEVTTQHHNSDSVESCPSSYETYCLYQGVCFYYPDMESYACNCVSGYMGERCQFSDLEWLELQQAEKEKRRNVVVAACMVVLVSLLSFTACVTYCYGSRGFFQKQPSLDNVSETSMTEESMTENRSPGVPRFYVVVEKEDGNFMPALAFPRRVDCTSCSSDKGLISENSTFCKHNRGCECSTLSPRVTCPTRKTSDQSSSTLSHSNPCTTFKPTAHPQTPGPESSLS